MIPDVSFVVAGRLTVTLERPTRAAVRTAGRVLGTAPGGAPGPRPTDLSVCWVTDRDARGQPEPEVRTGGAIGEPWSLTLPASAADRVPALRSIVLLMLLERDLVPLHAACGIRDGRLLAIAGPSGSGKTGLLLASMAQGVGAWAGEWILLGPDQVARLGHPLRVRAHHLRDVPTAGALLSPGWRVTVRTIGTAGGIVAGLGTVASRIPRLEGAGRRLERTGMAVTRRAYSDVPPPGADLGAGDGVAPGAGAGAGAGHDGTAGGRWGSLIGRSAPDVLALPRPPDTSGAEREGTTPLTATVAAARVTDWLADDLADLRVVRWTSAGGTPADRRTDVADRLERYLALLEERLRSTRCLALVHRSDVPPSELAALLVATLGDRQDR